jgi:phosphopantetheinyl transferase
MNLAQLMEGENSNKLGEQEETYLSWLSARESKKYACLPVYQKSHYLHGRIVLRKLLGSYLGRNAHDIRLAFGEFGKPALMDCCSGPWFNYSDTQDMVVYAFGGSGELGIDIEHLSRKPDYQRILQRKFSLAEAKEIGSLPDDIPSQIISQRFLAAWTRKESYGKAIGVGVNYKMNEVEVATDLGIANLAFEADTNNWYLTQLLFDEYVVSLTSSSSEKLRCFRLKINSNRALGKALIGQANH